MASQRRLVQLSSLIHENVAKVDDFIVFKGLPEPSFEASCSPILALSPEADVARNTALEALDELRQHLLGPVRSVVDEVMQSVGTMSLHALVTTKLATALPIDGTISLPALAEPTGMDPKDVTRLINHGASRNLFILKGQDEVTHSAKSKAIVTIPPLATFAKFALNNFWTAAPFVGSAMEKWPSSQEPTQTAYNIANRTDLSFFEDLAAHEGKAKAFAGCMAFIQSVPELNPDFVLGYDWSQHSDGTVVDIGGSTGEIALKIAKSHPNINIIVQDRSEVIAHAPRTAHKNVQFQTHDFFAPQPVHGADVYFFRMILHDWPTKYCIRILSALKPALKRGARVVLMEAVLPERGVLRPFQERRVRHFDMIMKMLFNAMERGQADWRELVAEADDEGRFKVVDLIRPAGSQLAFIVIEWTGYTTSSSGSRSTLSMHG